MTSEIKGETMTIDGVAEEMANVFHGQIDGDSMGISGYLDVLDLAQNPPIGGENENEAVKSDEAEVLDAAAYDDGEREEKRRRIMENDHTNSDECRYMAGYYEHGCDISERRHTEPTVSDLRYKHIKTLCNFLDLDNGTGRNWEQFGHEIFQGDRDACDEIDVIHLSYSGGGSQAKRFLKGLVTCYPTFTVTAFNDIAVKQRRPDISAYIKSLKCPVEQHFRDLTLSQQNKIARYLDGDVCVGGTWQMFADQVGFTNDEIEQFGLALKKRKQYSPAKCLLNFIKQNHPELKLTKVKEALTQIRRNDVVKYVDTVITEIVTTRETRGTKWVGD